MSHGGLRLKAPLLAELHHPPAELVGHVNRGFLVVHVDHVDAGAVEVPVEVRERGRASAEVITLEIQEYKYRYKIQNYKIQKNEKYRAGPGNSSSQHEDEKFIAQHSPYCQPTRYL